MDAVSPNERRIISRIRTSTIQPINLRIEAKGCDIPAKVQDISITGVGILTQQCLEPGVWLYLEPAKGRRRLSPELKVEVRHTTKLDEQAYLIGCRFSRNLTTEDMMALG